MYLTKEEEKLLESNNPTFAKSMEILVALGDIFEAERLIEIKSAHISGISYRNIGEAGLEWLESLDAEVAVKTTINPAGMDVGRWRKMGINEGFYEKQMQVIKAFERLKAEITLTCTPYYIYPPSFGDNLAWAESSAVVYANSVIGARTNKESGISAIASAITGKTPYYGMHVEENRAPTVLIVVKDELDDAKLSALGYVAGSKLRNEIALFRMPRKLSKAELKLLGAAMAAMGNIPIFHVEGQTPEWRSFPKPSEKLELELNLDFNSSCEPSLIAIGCPHLSRSELLKVLGILEKEGKKVKRDLWLFTSKAIAEECSDIVKRIENFGAKVFRDTCMVVSPASEAYECIMVNSGKALAYLPKLQKVNVSFGNMKECVKRALE
jgi:hypothetical protein